MSHKCPSCGYRFEDRESLDRHTDEGRGCPETARPMDDLMRKYADVVRRRKGYLH